MFPTNLFIRWLPLLLVTGCLSLQGMGADLWEKLGLKRTPKAAASVAVLGEDQLIAGLKEALGAGVEQAVRNLGREGGFLTNLAVKIPMPENLQKAERLLRAAGQDQLADNFVASMNRAAEKAVPEAAAVFRDALGKMTIADARTILSGTPDAATRFFERTTRASLQARFLPLVQEATTAVGVTANYKAMTARMGSLDSLGGGLFGGLRRRVVDDESLDLDGYVTGKALDGLFTMVAEEEKRIRENPVARTTDLLQKVFGTVMKPTP